MKWFSLNRRRKGFGRRVTPVSALVLAMPVFWVGCRSPGRHLAETDRMASVNVSRARSRALGDKEPLMLGDAGKALRERLLRHQQLPTRLADGTHPVQDPDVPEDDTLVPLDPIVLTPETALQIAARHSPEFQEAKDKLFLAALALDLEQAAFRRTFSAMLSGNYEHNRDGVQTVRSTGGSATASVAHAFRSGVEWTGSMAVDLVRLLTQGTASSLGVMADVGISIPLLRGAGRDIAGEPLKQAERNLLYAVYAFERFKRVFAVRVIADYLGTLQSAQQIRNARQNVQSLVMAARRARRLADAGRLPEFQVDQAAQNELRARSRWIEARDQHQTVLDRFKMQIGLPPDARVMLDPAPLDRLHAGLEMHEDATSEPRVVPPADSPVDLEEPCEHPDDTLGLESREALDLALDMRLDFRIAQARIADARRHIRVAEDQLRAELTLFGGVQSGARRQSASSATADDASIGSDRLRSSALLSLDLPLNRTAERLAYRRALLDLEAREREAQGIEDQIKRDVRQSGRQLRLALENLRIQREAVRLAERRVHSTDMLLQAGRAEIRDVLDAQESLIVALNAYTAAAVSHRVAELEFQRDLGSLDVSDKGMLEEVHPETAVPVPFIP